MLMIASPLVAAVLFAALGYLFARSRAESQHRSLKEDNSRLESDLRVTRQERDQAQDRYEASRAEHERARVEHQGREALLIEQSTRLEGASGRIATLETELDHLREQRGQADAEAEGLRTEREAANRRIRELEGESATRDQEHAALTATIEQLRSDLRDHQRDLEKLRTERAELEKRRAALDSAHKELERVREEQTRLQSEQVEATVAKMLKSSQETLSSTADDKLGATAKVVGDKIQELEKHLREFDGRRTTTETRLDEQIKRLAEENVRSREQTEALVQALRKPQVRGQWGELHLKRTVELANLREHVDFDLQVSVEGQERKQRPDMVVNLVNGRKVVVDAKVSLDAFMNAIEAADEADHERFMQEHAAQIRKHVDGLASKEYFTTVAGSPDFVLMYLPNEALLQAALDKRPDLYEYALGKRIMIATPTVLVPVLRTIALSWEEEKVRENSEAIQKLGRDIYDRLAVLSGHLSSLGNHLDQSMNFYNKTIGSLERSVLPAARRFPELGVSTPKDLPLLDQKDVTTRSIKAEELLPPVVPAPEVTTAEEEPIG
ncbi:DNA recombination protein RmuC [Nocardiopsis alkaliphila]|uniref:DNA recombination protein RmuC n=1 Tax=Nocardiopsis alkaliphila TaxID=225762 RepID=UPI001EF9F58F|nr:DNA recombination protein RmuC [Nocardiopsis alkaliphila]